MKQKLTLLIFSATTLLGLLLGLSALAVAKLPPQINGSPLPSLADMLEKVTPAVVNIHAEGRQVVYDPAASDPLLRRFLGNQIREKRTRGTGSGIIVDARQGYILTNAHVIAGADNITVTLNDNREFVAELIGSDPKADIAVIKIANKNLTALKITDSDKLRVGDFVVAIGNPYGLGQSVSSGIISALGRNNLGIEDYENFIQTDAPINPGNSGGALINLRGELIGINTAILGGKSGGNVGIGFAIPSNMATNLMDQLINYGQVQRGHLGLTVQNLTQRLANALNAQVNQGAVISSVIRGSAAEKSGLQEGDIITHVNGATILNGGDVRTRIGNLRVASRVDLKIIRDGKPRNITAVVGESLSQPVALPVWQGSNGNGY
ncbi:MAG: Do family serine endopeptidase [Thiotrichaceae bacterium]